MSETVYVRVTRHRLSRIMASLGAKVRADKATLGVIGSAVLELVQKAFHAKSKGGTDEAGESWQHLDPKTIAYSRAKRPNAWGKRETLPSQALTDRQQARWWAVYRQGLAIFKGDKGSAARRAWGILKAEGAITLFSKYSNVKVNMLYITGRTYNTIQVLRSGNGETVVGSEDVVAGAHHRGVPGRLPQRRLWPEPGKWPESWWQYILNKVLSSAVSVVTKVIKGA